MKKNYLNNIYLIITSIYSFFRNKIKKSNIEEYKNRMIDSSKNILTTNTCFFLVEL